MGDYVRLMARDGHEFDAWLTPPNGESHGAVVILQEIFGVNTHIREVADEYAADGYLAIAPCLFDRARRGVELAYNADTVQEGRGYVLQIPIEKVLLDITACINVVKHAGPVAAIGYCWGGTLAHLAACDLPIAAAAAYYGTRIVESLDKKTQAPVIYHFGARDKTIPPEAIEKIQAADPNGELFVYDADHGFNCNHRAAFDADAARLARARTLTFLAEKFA
jgi:carboxymethylenebutenolidase